MIIGTIDSGVPNKVLANGASLNDVIYATAANSLSHGDFVNSVGELLKAWCGILTKDQRSAIQKAAANSNLP